MSKNFLYPSERDQLNEEIINYLEKWRNKEGLSKNEVSKILNIGGYAQYVRGKIPIGINTAKKIDSNFNTDFETRLTPLLPSPPKFYSKHKKEIQKEIQEYIRNYKNENKLTNAQLEKMLNIRVGGLLYGGCASPAMSKKIDAFFGTDFTEQLSDAYADIPFYLPDWVCEAPKEIRPYIEQEYPINEELAREMASRAKTYEDVKHIRAAWYAGVYA